MILYEQGRQYWLVAQRYHANRSNPVMKPTAVRDMQRIMCETSSPSVRQRAHSFVLRHAPRPSPPTGPRFA